MLSYKIKTNLLKIFSFLCIIGILYIGYILIKNTSNNIYDYKLDTPPSPPSANINNDLEYKIVLNDSVFEGLNKNLNSYVIKAEKAIKDSNNKYKLDKINVLYKLNENHQLTIDAKNGFLNEETNILDLQDDVKVFLEDIVFDTNDAKIDLNKKDIISDSTITLSYKNSSVTSDSFSSQNDNNLIIFKGNVFTTIDLSNLGVETSIKKKADTTLPDHIYIKSSSLIIDRIKQKVIYSGNVIVYSEDTILKTNTLEIIYKMEGNEKTVDYVVIPTKLAVKREAYDELLIADSAKYFLDSKKLILLGNIILQHDNSTLKTDKLIYYIDLKATMKK